MERDHHPGPEQGAGDTRWNRRRARYAKLPANAPAPSREPDARPGADVIMSRLPRTRPQRDDRGACPGAAAAPATGRRGQAQRAARPATTGSTTRAAKQAKGRAPRASAPAAPADHLRRAAAPPPRRAARRRPRPRPGPRRRRPALRACRDWQWTGPSRPRSCRSRSADDSRCGRSTRSRAACAAADALPADGRRPARPADALVLILRRARSGARGRAVADALGRVLAADVVSARRRAWLRQLRDGRLRGAGRRHGRGDAGRAPVVLTWSASHGRHALRRRGRAGPGGADLDRRHAAAGRRCRPAGRGRATRETGRVSVRGPLARQGDPPGRRGHRRRRGRAERRGALGPAELASQPPPARRELQCARRPRVAVLVTGDELVEPGAPLAPGRSATRTGTRCARRSPGRRARSLSVRDRRRRLRRDGRRAAPGAGCGRVVTTGGVSVGPHDHVKPALAELGVEEVFWGVALRPGKPTWFGTHAAPRARLRPPGEPGVGDGHLPSVRAARACPHAGRQTTRAARDGGDGRGLPQAPGPRPRRALHAGRARATAGTCAPRRRRAPTCSPHAGRGGAGVPRGRAGRRARRGARRDRDPLGALPVPRAGELAQLRRGCASPAPCAPSPTASASRATPWSPRRRRGSARPGAGRRR